MKHFCGISGINLSGMYHYWKRIMFYFSQKYGIYNRCISALAFPYIICISCRSWTSLCRAGSAGNELTKMTSEENLCGFLFPFEAVFSLSCLRCSSFDSELSTEEVDAEVMLLGARVVRVFTLTRNRPLHFSQSDVVKVPGVVWKRCSVRRHFELFPHLRGFIPFVSLWDFKECECVCVFL